VSALAWVPETVLVSAQASAWVPETVLVSALVPEMVLVLASDLASEQAWAPAAAAKADPASC
jgi:hypothetical protein